MEFAPRKVSSDQKGVPSHIAYVRYDILKSQFGEPVWAGMPASMAASGTEIKFVPNPGGIDASKLEENTRSGSPDLLRLLGAGEGSFLLAQYDSKTHACVNLRNVEPPVFSVDDDWATPKKIILTPLAVVADVATSPVQLLYYLVFCNSRSLSGRTDCTAQLPWN